MPKLPSGRSTGRSPGRPPKPGSTPVTNRIRERRFHANEMTQQQLADRAGVSRQTIVAVEQGRYAPSLELAFRIARAFGAGVEEVFSYPDDNGPAP